MPLSKEILNELFEYRDGEIYYKVTRSRNKAGSKAGTYRPHDNAYHVTINKKHYLMHRIIFMMHYGYMPKFVDHFDRNRANNRIENLREATNEQNAQNAKMRDDNTSGFKGVIYNKKWDLWAATINTNKKRITLSFKDKIDAMHMSALLRKRYHREFACHA
jgi:hypothetical protein